MLLQIYFEQLKTGFTMYVNNNDSQLYFTYVHAKYPNYIHQTYSIQRSAKLTTIKVVP